MYSFYINIHKYESCVNNHSEILQGFNIKIIIITSNCGIEKTCNADVKKKKKMLTQSFKWIHPKMDILGQALSVQRCRKTQKRILFWFCTTDTNNYHAYLISGMLNLNRSLLSYWIYCQGNSFIPVLLLRTMKIVLENAVSLLPLGLIFVEKDYRGSSVGTPVCDECLPTTRLEKICTWTMTLWLTVV